LKDEIVNIRAGRPLRYEQQTLLTRNQPPGKNKMTILELTILGIVAETPNHAYNIDKLIVERGLRDRFNIGFSSIYATLNKLQDDGLLESSFSEQKNLPGRRIYAITSQGRRALTEELVKAISQPQKLPSLFEAGLSFGALLQKAELREALSLYEAELGRLVQNKVRALTDMDTTDQIKRALLTRPLTLWQAERKWIRELLSLI